MYSLIGLSFELVCDTGMQRLSVPKRCLLLCYYMH